jgi:hypothetical protein
VRENPGIRLPAPIKRPDEVHAYLGVIPVAQAVRIGDLTLIVTMIERMSRFAMLHLHVYHPSETPRVQRRMPPRLLVLQAEARDGLGTTYRVRPAGGIGGGGETDQTYELTPAIPATARTLTLTLSSLAWEHMETHERVAIAPGPWSFTIDLSGQVDVSLAAGEERSGPP